MVQHGHGPRIRSQFRLRPHAASIAAAAAPEEGRRRAACAGKAGYRPRLSRRPAGPRRMATKASRLRASLIAGPRSCRTRHPPAAATLSRRSITTAVSWSGAMRALRPAWGLLDRGRSGSPRRLPPESRAAWPLLSQPIPEGRRNRPGKSARLASRRRARRSVDCALGCGAGSTAAINPHPSESTIASTLAQGAGIRLTTRIQRERPFPLP